MLKIILLVLAGVASGVLGGMGMGGGTVLIPVLTIFFGVKQKIAQAANLVAFIPMAVISLILHVKNGLVEKEGLLWIIVPACLVSLGGSFAAAYIDGKILGRIFGWFLLALSVFQFFSEEITEKIEKKSGDCEKGNKTATKCTKR
jgi:uncharacterized membrane protein YfcA